MDSRGGQARGEPALDALYAEVLASGESPARARELLARFPDEALLAAVLQRAVPVAFLEAVAGVSPWSERPRLLARVVLNPRAPRALAQRLVGVLYWRDLAEVAATPRIAGAVRARAESQLRDGLADMRLGDRVTLARLATPPLLPLLLADGDPRVAAAALLNARLREEDLVTALRREDVRPPLVEAVAACERWKPSYAVQLALVLQPKTPLPLALVRITALVPRDLRRVAGDEALRPLVRAAAREVLEHESGGAGGAQPPES